ncbi:hypothetical protein BDN67DRAFT_985914 [Paxillus ammoniavirescens]|nr:hypothetical protein BDN67DRAFT_985914 [Paxillus ammoniavirescens]
MSRYDSTATPAFFVGLAVNKLLLLALSSGKLSEDDMGVLTCPQAGLIGYDMLQFGCLKLLAQRFDAPPSVLKEIKGHIRGQRLARNHAQTNKRELTLAATGAALYVQRNHASNTGFKCGTLLVNQGNKDLVPQGSTTLTIPANNSCLGKVELAVLQGKCGAHPDLLAYINGVIDGVVNDRKNCQFQPNYEATLAEISTACFKAIDNAGFPSMAVKGNVTAQMIHVGMGL